MRRHLIVLGIAASLAACASAPARPDLGGAPLRITGNVTTIELAPVHLAIDRGLYAGPTTLQNGGVPNLFGLVSPAATGEPLVSDISTNAETQALRVSATQPDLRIILTVSEGLYRIVASRSAGIETLADLRGKRIGTVPNTSSNYFLHKMLQSAGMTIDDVTIVPMGQIALYRTAFAEGTVDAITIWEPGAEYAAQSLGDDAIEFSGHGIYRELFNLNTTRQALEDPAMRTKIVEFVAALIQASEMIAQDPSRAQQLVAASANYPVQDVAGAWVHHTYPATLMPDLLDVMVEEDVWVARETGRAPRTRDELAPLVDPSVEREARALLAARGQALAPLPPMEDFAARSLRDVQRAAQDAATGR